jgi:chlorobactene glucosyltransferase
VIVLPLLAAAPWLVMPLVLAWRMQTAPSLSAESATPPADPPLVSVIIPARNEARNIARCMGSILASRYPALEVIVVNDRSEDGTGEIAREVAEGDARVRVIDAAPLPEGWFGKQWACAQGAAAARGGLLCFTDADTVHGPELLTRSVNAMRGRALGFLTVGGDQEMCTFWERVLQPLVLTMILARYGGVRAVNESPRVVDKIANGQFMLFTAEAYRACGGHEAVRGKVAEDLALAQVLFAQGVRTEVVVGTGHLATRMYTSLGEVVRGWMKNIYAGAADAMPGGAVGRALLPLVLLGFPATLLAPVVVAGLGAVGVVSGGVVVWGVACTLLIVLWWAMVYVRAAKVSPVYALAFPIGAVVLTYIIVRAVGRGRTVAWKGRTYRAA